MPRIRANQNRAACKWFPHGNHANRETKHLIQKHFMLFFPQVRFQMNYVCHSLCEFLISFFFRMPMRISISAGLVVQSQKYKNAQGCL